LSPVPPATKTYTLSLHDALPIYQFGEGVGVAVLKQVARLLPAEDVIGRHTPGRAAVMPPAHQELEEQRALIELPAPAAVREDFADRKSTRLNSSHDQISYAVFCL